MPNAKRQRRCWNRIGTAQIANVANRIHLHDASQNAALWDKTEQKSFRLGVKRVVPRTAHTSHAAQHKPLI